MHAEIAAPVALDAESCARMLPKRSEVGHKFTFGVVVAVAGSLDYAGAAHMTALGAARSGAGMVALAVPDSLRPVFAGRLPEAILVGLPEAGDTLDVDRAARAVLERQPAAIIVGPGLKETEPNQSLLLRLLADSPAPIVVDAGALTMLAQSERWWTHIRPNCVLTPHAGEFKRLTGVEIGSGDEERSTACAVAARRFGQVVVLKGARTVVAAPDGRSAVSPFANALLATAGSGDVLAGFIGGLLAQGSSAFDAACAGVYLHGRAGERLSERLGDAGLLASELPLAMALARREIVAAHAS